MMIAFTFPLASPVPPKPYLCDHFYVLSAPLTPLVTLALSLHFNHRSLTPVRARAPTAIFFHMSPVAPPSFWVCAESRCAPLCRHSSSRAAQWTGRVMHNDVRLRRALPLGQSASVRVYLFVILSIHPRTNNYNIRNEEQVCLSGFMRSLHSLWAD